MAEKGSDGPSLELPSFGFGRRKRRRTEESAGPDPSTEQADDVEADPHPQPEPDPEPVPVPEAAPAPEPEPEPAPLPAPRPEPEPDTPTAAEVRRQRSGPLLPPVAAVALAGLLAGGLLVGLTWGSLHVCELVRGTSSCGNPGIVLLLVAVALAVVLGRAVLAALGVGEAGGTSFLGVGLVTVIALLVSDLLLDWWMLVVMPLVAVVAFALAHWVSTAFVEPTEDWMHR